MKSNLSQASMELILTIGIIMLIFVVVVLTSIEKSRESDEVKMFLDARRIMTSVADNINTISEQGSGFYLYFSIPERIFGYRDYNISAYENIVEITWENYVLSTPVIVSNVSILDLKMGETERNCVMNKDGRVCIRSNCGNINVLLYSPYEDGMDPLLLDGISQSCNINVTFTDNVSYLEDYNRLGCFDILWLAQNSINASSGGNLSSAAEDSIKNFVLAGGKLWSSSQDYENWNNSWQWLPHYLGLAAFEDNDTDVAIQTPLFSHPNVIDPDDLRMGEPFMYLPPEYDVLAYVQDTTEYAHLLQLDYGKGTYLISSVDTGSDPSYDPANRDMFENVIKYLNFRFRCD
ncbi:MAG: hypothetical protein V1921_04705 [Candidatus Altiarchaeota archaeon]